MRLKVEGAEATPTSYFRGLARAASGALPSTSIAVVAARSRSAHAQGFSPEQFHNYSQLGRGRTSDLPPHLQRILYAGEATVENQSPAQLWPARCVTMSLPLDPACLIQILMGQLEGVTEDEWRDLIEDIYTNSRAPAHPGHPPPATLDDRQDVTVSGLCAFDRPTGAHVCRVHAGWPPVLA